MNKSIEISKKIKLPKNQIKVLTLDKEGNPTGKQKKTTNKWVKNGYDTFLFRRLSPSAQNNHLSFANFFLEGTSTSDPGPSGPHIAYIHIGTSTDEIIKTQDTLSSGTVLRSGERLSPYNGKIYPRMETETVSDIECLKISWLVSFPYGSVNMNIGQIGLGITNNTLIMCGTNLTDANGDPETFNVTSEEQLVIEYSILLPLEYVVMPGQDPTVLQTTEALVNGTDPVEITFSQSAYWLVLNGQWGTLRIFASGIANPVNLVDNRVFVTYTDNSTVLAIDTLTAEILNDGSRIETSSNFTIGPEPLASDDKIIKSFYRRWAATNNSFFLLADIEPGIVKRPNDRFTMSFKFTVEIDEIED